jgi:hypothetical protein
MTLRYDLNRREAIGCFIAGYSALLFAIGLTTLLGYKTMFSFIYTLFPMISPVLFISSIFGIYGGFFIASRPIFPVSEGLPPFVSEK